MGSLTAAATATAPSFACSNSLRTGKTTGNLSIFQSDRRKHPVVADKFPNRSKEGISPSEQGNDLVRSASRPLKITSGCGPQFDVIGARLRVAMALLLLAKKYKHAFWLVLEAHMPTLDEERTAFLGGPELVEQLKQFDAEFAVAYPGSENLFLDMVLMAAAIGHRAEENFPSKAYGPYLRNRGANPIWAQRMASLAISLGTRRSNKSRQIRPVVEALRFLAQGKRQGRGSVSSEVAARGSRRDVDAR